jgi:hypothetical protein
MKFKLPSWEEGEEFIQELATLIEAAIETRDAKQIVETSHGKVTFHPDDRGFAYITCKITNNELKEIISQLQEKFS